MSTGGMTGTGGGSTQDVKNTGGGSSQDVATGGKMSTGGSPATGGAVATGGSTSTEKCGPVEYKFYITASKKTIRSSTINCTDLETGDIIPPVVCSDPTCCYYTIPNDCHAWICNEITSATCDPNDPNKPCMPRIPSYDPNTQSCFLDWGTYVIITKFNGDSTHYYLEEGTDYLLVPDTTAGTCSLVHPPHDGEHFYN
jgi:hypothetical protein